MAFLLLGGNVLLLVSGQILWKQALARAGGPGLVLLRDPRLWGGLMAYGAATLLWLAVLGRLRLSVAYPLQATAYALGMAAARWALGEPVPPLRWAGAFLILAGAALVALPTD